jgi:competence ComEA-like helix-hairpin-helix protein
MKKIVFSFLGSLFLLSLFSFSFLKLKPFSTASLSQVPKTQVSENLKAVSEKLDSLNSKLDSFSSRLDSLSQNFSDFKNLSPRKESKEEKEIAKKENQEFCEIPDETETKKEVIFNEICWMGDEKSFKNEWLEIKNLTEKEIDLSGWQVLSEKIKFAFPEGAKILPGEILLLAREGANFGVKPDFLFKNSIKNEKENLYLFDQNCDLEDFVKADPKWEAGDKEKKLTAERKKDLSWQTSENPGGTPKKENSQGRPVETEKKKEETKTGEKKVEKQKETPQLSLSFPKEVFANQEFEVSVSAWQFEEKNYDLKISLLFEGKNISEIFNPKEKTWQSSNYYLKEIFKGPSFSGNFKLIFKNENIVGDAQISAKVRESGSEKIVAEFSEKIKILQTTIFVIPQNLPQEKEQEKECVDINHASVEELEKITGVGPTIAQRIVENRPYSSLDDLIKVKGIGEVTLQKIKDQGLACVK